MTPLKAHLKRQILAAYRRSLRADAEGQDAAKNAERMMSETCARAAVGTLSGERDVLGDGHYARLTRWSLSYKVTDRMKNVPSLSVGA